MIDINKARTIKAKRNQKLSVQGTLGQKNVGGHHLNLTLVVKTF